MHWPSALSAAVAVLTACSLLSGANGSKLRSPLFNTVILTVSTLYVYENCIDLWFYAVVPPGFTLPPTASTPTLTVALPPTLVPDSVKTEVRLKKVAYAIEESDAFVSVCVERLIKLPQLRLIPFDVQLQINNINAMEGRGICNPLHSIFHRCISLCKP